MSFSIKQAFERGSQSSDSVVDVSLHLASSSAVEMPVSTTTGGEEVGSSSHLVLSGNRRLFKFQVITRKLSKNNVIFHVIFARRRLKKKTKKHFFIKPPNGDITGILYERLIGMKPISLLLSSRPVKR